MPMVDDVWVGWPLCLCVRAVKGKWLELSTPNLVDTVHGIETDTLLVWVCKYIGTA